MIFRPTARETLIAGFIISAIFTVFTARPAAADDKASACDTATAGRFDQDRPASVTPIDLGKIDAAKAQAACEQSVAATPTDKRQVYQLGRAYLVAKDYPKAIDTFKKASDLGSAMAMSDLATMYDMGIGTPKDPAAARALAEKSAAAGNVSGAYNLAVSYQLGRGGAKDFVKARELLEKAAAAGVPKAFFRLGYSQELGIGGPVDMQKAKSSYLSCSMEPTPGSSQAICQRRLGFMYETGKLGRIDPVAAKDLFEKSAAGGDIEALRALGQVYEMGKGVRPDPAKARDFYEKAAAKGDSGAMRQLATMYERGLGVPRDPAQARSWTDKAKSAADTEKALKDAGEGN